MECRGCYEPPRVLESFDALDLLGDAHGQPVGNGSTPEVISISA